MGDFLSRGHRFAESERIGIANVQARGCRGRFGFFEVRSIIMGEAGRAEIRSDARARSPQLQLMRRTTGTEPLSVSTFLIHP
jgi:hypothetical protein